LQPRVRTAQLVKRRRAAPQPIYIAGQQDSICRKWPYDELVECVDLAFRQPFGVGCAVHGVEVKLGEDTQTFLFRKVADTRSDLGKAASAL
jgi:hypothetical protein